MKKLIVANWKMNPNSLKKAKKIFSETKKTASRLKNIKTVICPPFIYISNLKPARRQGGSQISNLKIGAQDLFWKDKGSYTGEISTAMLKNFGVKYVIVGHSERRKYQKETNAIVNKKTKIALENNLKVILCIGEKKRDSKRKYLSFVKEEITEGLRDIQLKYLKNLIIAYEPIWAIGERAKRADKPEDVFKMGIFIRKIILSVGGRKISKSVPILYGGSVDKTNSENFLKNGGIQGLLVGRSSLDFKRFKIILKKANTLI